MTFDYLALLADLGVRGRVAAGGRQFYGSCPLHPNNSTNFSVSLETGAWTCFVGCGPEHGRTFPLLVSLVRGCSFAEALRWMRSRRRERPPHVVEEALRARLAPPEKVDIVELFDPLELPPPGLPPEIAARGFDADDAERWDWRWDKAAHRLVMPVPGGVVMRQLRPGAAPKYLYSRGFAKNATLYPLLKEDAGGIILTEGLLDACWLRKHGYPAAATFGAGLSKDQALALQRAGITEVTLAFDNDLAGIKATESAFKQLIESGYLLRDVYWVRWPEEVSARTGKTIKDANDCSPEQLARAIQGRISFAT
jgi:DNA primase